MVEKTIVTKVSKWGNGYGIRIPKRALQQHQLTEGSEVIIETNDTGVVITPKTLSLADMTLDEILAGVTPHMVSAEAESAFGVPIGDEIW